MKIISLFLSLIAVTLGAQAEPTMTTYGCLSDGELVRDVQVFSDNGNTPSRIAYTANATWLNNKMGTYMSNTWIKQTYKLTEQMTDDDLTLKIEGINDLEAKDLRTGSILQFKLNNKGTFEWFAARLPTYSEKVTEDSWGTADQFGTQIVICRPEPNLCLTNPNAC